jgi:hypothetical protein
MYCVLYASSASLRTLSAAGVRKPTAHPSPMPTTASAHLPLPLCAS